MAKKSELSSKLGYEVKRRNNFYWFYARQHSPACLNAMERFRVNGPFETKAEAKHAAIIHYWNAVHKEPNMRQFLWTPN